MAKRKRLTPAQQGYLAATPEDAAPRPMSGPLPAPPIARVAGEASATAALGELSEAMDSARREGRMIETLPLAAVDPSYLVRDRLMQEGDEMAALVTSLRARGQQTPIEVVALPAPRNGFTHGLVSGWRRLSALKRLDAVEEDQRFAVVRARVIRPANMQAAYVAMVEENEIRANLSHYERARIVLRAWHEEIYPTQKAALQGLFDSVSRSRRSKINSFIPVVEALDQVLRFPTAIPEKLGLDLSRALQADSGFASRLYAALRAPEAESAEEELDRIATLLADADRRPALPPVAGEPAPVLDAPELRHPPRQEPHVTMLDPEAPARRRAATRVITARFDAAASRIELTGPGVDADTFAALQDWLKSRG